jgi:hypothetical protein
VKRSMLCPLIQPFPPAELSAERFLKKRVPLYVH